MSVRAYKIKKIETERPPTFNVWHDSEWLSKVDGIEFDDTNGAITTIKLLDAEAAREWCKTTEHNQFGKFSTISEARAYYAEVIEQVIKDCDDEDTSAEYLCY